MKSSLEIAQEHKLQPIADIARAASSVDTLVGFVRDLRARYPDPANAVSSARPPGQG